MQQRLAQFWKYRILIFFGIFVIAGFYSFLNRGSLPQTPKASPTPSAAELPVASPSATLPAAASPAPPLAPPVNTAYMLWPDLAEKTIYYQDFNDSLFKQVAIDGSGVQTLLEQTLSFIDFVAWSPDHKKVLLRAQNDTGNRIENPLYQPDLPVDEPVIGLYDLAQKRFTPLNSHITKFAFLSQDEIIYQYRDNRYNNLSVAKPDGTGWKNIAELKAEIELIRSGETVLMREQNKSEIIRYGTGGKILERFQAPAELRLSQSSWSPASQQAVYFTRENNQVQIKSFSSGQIKTLTSLEQQGDLSILWDNRTSDIYLATPGGLLKVASSKP